MKETITEILMIGVMGGIIAAVGAIIWFAVDYLWWKLLPIEASNLGDFLSKTWFVAPSVGIVALRIALWRGTEAIDFAVEVWKDIW